MRGEDPSRRETTGDAGMSTDMPGASSIPAEVAGTMGKPLEIRFSPSRPPRTELGAGSRARAGGDTEWGGAHRVSRGEVH